MWLKIIGLSLATQKSEVIVLTKTLTHNHMENSADGRNIIVRKFVKYFGLYQDSKLINIIHAKKWQKRRVKYRII